MPDRLKTAAGSIPSSEKVCKAPEPVRAPWILPLIVLAQFAGTSLWFAGNAVIADLQRAWGIGGHIIGHVTAAVQFGFIAGTLVFAFFTVSDRFSPRRVFFVCALAGSTANLMVYIAADGVPSLLVLRFLTGFFLAGIYPVGMKIAAGWYARGLGRALGFLIGALVVGTAFPHLLKGAGRTVAWETVVVATSAIALCGGVLILLFVPDGPHLSRGSAFDSRALWVIFRSGDLRSAAFGYFGHMWELYTLWAFVPLILATYAKTHPAVGIHGSRWAFAIIAAGSLGCGIGGVLSRRFGSTPVAFVQLAASGLCCLASPLLFQLPRDAFLGAMLFWGVVVVGDSPQFSAVVARTAPPDLMGSALTIVNCIGFSITILSIQMISWFSGFVSPERLFLLLAPGPLLGLAALGRLLRKEPFS